MAVCAERSGGSFRGSFTCFISVGPQWGQRSGSVGGKPGSVLTSGTMETSAEEAKPETGSQRVNEERVSAHVPSSAVMEECGDPDVALPPLIPQASAVPPRRIESFAALHLNSLPWMFLHCCLGPVHTTFMSILTNSRFNS